jgi:hypothetical protein
MTSLRIEGHLGRTQSVLNTLLSLKASYRLPIEVSRCARARSMKTSLI